MRLFFIPMTASHELFSRRTPADICIKVDQVHRDEIPKAKAAVAAFFQTQPRDVKFRQFESVSSSDASSSSSRQMGIFTCAVLVYVNWQNWVDHPKFKRCDSQDDFFALLNAIEEMEKSYLTTKALGIAHHQPHVSLDYDNFRHPCQDKLWLTHPRLDMFPNSGREVTFRDRRIIYPPDLSRIIT